VNRRLRDIVASKLILDWSPEQISGWLKTQYPDDESMRVSHETIYRSLFIQARGVLKKELMDHLRSKRRMRRSRHASEHGQSRGQIVDAISIRERPAEVEDRVPAFVEVILRPFFQFPKLREWNAKPAKMLIFAV